MNMMLAHYPQTIERSFCIEMKQQIMDMETSKATALTIAYLNDANAKREEHNKTKKENKSTVALQELQRQLLKNNQND